MKLLIIGVGLIGGSLALARKARNRDVEIIGSGRRRASLEKALELGAIDRFEMDPAAAAAQADIILLSVPMSAMRPVLTGIRPGLSRGTIVTDAGSVKGSFVRDAQEILGDNRRVVPGHPIAGDENSGVEAAYPTLFEDRRVILTPPPALPS